MKKAAVAVFPGSNCDKDALDVLSRVYNIETVKQWHEDALPHDIGLLILPGGFSYGDYLRAGAIARFSKVVEEIPAFLKRGGKVIGICNGFQVLTEAGLLPGALSKNISASFQCEEAYVKVIHAVAPFFSKAKPHQILKLPIAHSMGRYVASEQVLRELEQENQIVLKYCSQKGDSDDVSNVNGSTHAIAGIVNRDRNILGLMPHPERACEMLLGSIDGRVVFDSILEHV